MASSNVTLLKPPEAPGNLRSFRRRKVTVKVDIANAKGDGILGDSIDLGMGGFRFCSKNALAAGVEAIAKIQFSGGATIRTPVKVVWQHSSEGLHEHGIRFEKLSNDDRFALLDAVYARAANKPLASVFDGAWDTVAKDGSSSLARALSPVHHAYYLKLIRRIEHIHSLSEAQTDRLLFAILQQGEKLADTLLTMELTSYDKLDSYLAALYGVPYLNLSITKPDAAVADLIPESIAFSQNIVPIKQVNGKYIVAMSDPLDLPGRDLVSLRTKDRFELRFCFIDDIEKAAKDVYQAASLHSADRLIDKATAVEGPVQLLPESTDVTDLETLRRLSDATPIISLVDSLFRSAIEERASDVHLEPMDDTIFVRFRLDGVLHQMRTLPRNILAGVVSRIKILARMDITVRHVPQDGRLSMRYNGKDFELRVASLPTVFGEKIVVRLLEKNPTFKTLKAIGFSERNYELFAPLIRRPHGMILYCGPTGSGKSTTLFACIQEIHDGTANITTVEDPVEYRVRGINHVELNPKRGLTFPTVLRALLRTDPDVIYVGEIRDRETADLAVRAALTGHLLFSTLHTNTAIQAITRLVDIGVDASLIGASLVGVVGQRLIRKVCEWCKESYTTPPSDAVVLREILHVEHAPLKLFRGRGCAHCHDTGYYGRSSVHEVVVVDEELARLISAGADSKALADCMTKRGFVDLRADAISRLIAGETTLSEVMRVTV
ncbi:MAG: type II secretion system protein GspE [Candidatus Eremiobacter antarcticus]|nr:Flp pilus assembly complex ATPase component TadA [Candidatus Eremiobacteraeota bacterium]PZR62810.1 MAG: type II secretion system protein GspE [Candidatus Eremiobacter sp. RRmetagenome_bin22]